MYTSEKFISSILESVLFDDDTLLIDYDKFKIGNFPLFIIGLSGSGKTTLGMNISKKYNIELVSMDNMSFNFVPNEIRRKLKLKLTRDEVNKLWVQLAEFVFIHYKNKRVVIEGVDLMFITNSLFFQYPTILTGKSLIRASIDAGIRNYKHHPEEYTTKFHSIWNRLKSNTKTFYIQLEKFKKERLRYATSIIPLKDKDQL